MKPLLAIALAATDVALTFLAMVALAYAIGLDHQVPGAIAAAGFRLGIYLPQPPAFRRAFINRRKS